MKKWKKGVTPKSWEKYYAEFGPTIGTEREEKEIDDNERKVSFKWSEIWVE